MSELQRIRKKAGLSQRELAEASGVNYRVIQDYEQGRKHLSQAKADMVVRLSHSLGCTVEQLIEFDVSSIKQSNYAPMNKDRKLYLYSTALSDKMTIGSVGVYIDQVVPCLKNNDTGDLVDTAVIRIESRGYLKGFQRNNGWQINWNELSEDLEVYALVLKSTNEIQGLIALRKDEYAQAMYIHWVCTAPHNNIHEKGIQKYSGVGGHLFAIAVDKAYQYGFEGCVFGFAANRDLLELYKEKFGAEHIGMLHIYHFMIFGEASDNLLEVYNYEWNN